jgi:glutamine cyclotransferase
VKQILCIFFAALIMSCNSNGDKTPDAPTLPSVPSLNYSITATYPHDTSYYTEGLLFYKGKLYESTGLEGKSKLVQTDLKTGKAVEELKLDPQYFGEGLVILRDTIYQLTYKTKVGFKYTLKDFKKIGEFTFSTDGWGLTTNGTQLIRSDGSSNLYYYEPSTFRLLRTQPVTQGGSLVFNINELEYIDGYIYANQWQYPYILKIDPASGEVIARADLTERTNYIKANYPFAEVLNGIAYNDSTKKIYVTGKNWPEMYEIQFGK